MKKLFSILALAGLVCCLTACKKQSGTATPGDLMVPTPMTIHKSENTTDVSGDYLKRLCTYAWLDTTDMHYLVLKEDGSFTCMKDEELTEQCSQGRWSMLKDEEGYLSLKIEKDGEAACMMYNVELYDQSLYAYGEDGFSYIWLLCTPEN